ncbi:hypothetical protein [Mesobacterium pallidum]|uniref:hypothetical protein n=1 Tax=Mesobacterium pallidum TaxID=2872037 RepID=UPI001EE33A7F|nr:hypothetical protein [Mesobacterium pallidum]
MAAGRRGAALLVLGLLCGCAAPMGPQAPIASVAPSPGKVLAAQEARALVERERVEAAARARAEAQARAETARKAREEAAAARREKVANERMQKLAQARTKENTLLARRKAQIAAKEREAVIAAQRAAAAQAAHEAAKAAIPVYPSTPGRPYTAIGPIRAVVTRLLPIEEAPSEAKAIDALREVALKQGADGIIHVSVSEMHRVPMTGGGRTATGLAVLFPDPAPAPAGPAPMSAMRTAPVAFVRPAVAPRAAVPVPVPQASRSVSLPPPATLPARLPGADSLLAPEEG